jgi:hypothetical protein
VLLYCRILKVDATVNCRDYIVRGGGGAMTPSEETFSGTSAIVARLPALK